MKLMPRPPIEVLTCLGNLRMDVHLQAKLMCSQGWLDLPEVLQQPCLTLIHQREWGVVCGVLSHRLSGRKKLKLELGASIVA